MVQDVGQKKDGMLEEVKDKLEEIKDKRAIYWKRAEK